jgi:hypothetical protein
MAIMWGSYIALTGQDSPAPRMLDISASYKSEGSEALIVETFHIDLLDYWNTTVERTELERLGETLEKALASLAKGVEKIAVCTEELSRIAEPTGLTVSVTALRNLRRLTSGADPLIEPIDPKRCDEDIFAEVLGVPLEVAAHLSNFFDGRGPTTLDEIPGMTSELAVDVRRYFQTVKTASAGVEPNETG